MMGESAGRSRNHPVGEGAEKKASARQRSGLVPVRDEEPGLSTTTKGRLFLWSAIAIVGAAMVLINSPSVLNVIGLILVAIPVAAGWLEDRFYRRRGSSGRP